MLQRIIRVFSREEKGQALADYCLLTALVALIAVGILIHVAGGVQNLWTVANSSLATGKTTSGSTSSSGAGARPGQ